MPFSGDTFTHLFDWVKDPQNQKKINDARLEAEFDGVDTGLSAVAARVTTAETDISALESGATGKLSLSGGQMTGRLELANGTVTGNSGMATSTGGLGEIEAQNNGTGAAMMAFHRSGAFAAYLGLDTDNQWKVGGWSMGAVAHKIRHDGNMTVSTSAPSGGSDGDFWFEREA